MTANDPMVSVEFIMYESEAHEFVKEIKKYGAKLQDDLKPWDIPPRLIHDYGDAQFEPLIVVAVAVSIGILIKRVSDVWLDHKQSGGQVIDIRGGKVELRVAPFLERGKIVVICEDGPKVFERNDEAIDAIGKLMSHG